MKKTLQLGWVTKRGSATPRKPTKPAPGKGDEPNLETIIICMEKTLGSGDILSSYIHRNLEALRIGPRPRKKHLGINHQPSIEKWDVETGESICLVAQVDIRKGFCPGLRPNRLVQLQLFFVQDLAPLLEVKCW